MLTRPFLLSSFFFPTYQNTWIDESADSLAALLMVHGKELLQRTQGENQLD
jgi:hypothetical protein